jgi:Zn-dependent peptidase ImmA (M78 family)
MLKEVGQAASLSPDDQQLLSGLLDRARRFAELGDLLGVESLATQFQPTKAKRSKPYRAGYRLATTVRGLLGIERAPVYGLQGVIENRFGILVAEHAFSDRRVQAACCRSGNARLIALSPTLNFETSRRTILAHELCHHLIDLGEEGALADQGGDDEFSLDRSPEEKRARAFAVMFLTPADAIREVLGAPNHQISIQSASDMVTRLRTQFGIGFEAMAWHLFHLEYFNFHEDDVAALSSYGDGLDVAGFEDGVGRDGLHRRVQAALRRDAISGERARTILGEYASAMA